jgi:hypothetical protein
VCNSVTLLSSEQDGAVTHTHTHTHTHTQTHRHTHTSAPLSATLHAQTCCRPFLTCTVVRDPPGCNWRSINYIITLAAALSRQYAFHNKHFGGVRHSMPGTLMAAMSRQLAFWLEWEEDICVCSSCWLLYAPVITMLIPTQFISVVKLV